MEYRQVSLERLPEIVEVNHRIFEGMYEWLPYFFDTYQEKFAHVDPVIFVGEDRGVVVGDAIAFPREGNWYLWILGILFEYRKQGVASALLDLQERYARDHGYSKITVKVYNVSKDMLRLLLSRGYDIVAVHPHEKVKYYAVMLELIV